LALTGGVGAMAVAGRYLFSEGYAGAAGPSGVSGLGTGTVPEQIHLVWGSDPTTEMTVAWASPQAEVTPEVILNPGSGQSVFPATAVGYTDGLSGEQVFTYYVTLTGLSPDTSYTYQVLDGSTPSVTFQSTLTTAPTGRFAFAFTSFGDLGTPGTGATYTLANGTTITSSSYSESQWNAYNAVGEVEALAAAQSPSVPLLFHLLNGDLCYADKETINSSGSATPGQSGVQPAPEVWRDFGLNTQRSAANRPWMPCIGNHEAELDNAQNGYASYLARFPLPNNGTAFPGNFYSFQVGSVLVISLDANDVAYQGAGAYNVGLTTATDHAGNTIPASDSVYNQYYTGNFSANANGTLSPAGTGGNVQTQWLEATLASARGNATIDWIVVMMHQCVASSSTDNGCDTGIRQCWVPLFDQYEVDLVVNGHDHDYERTWPLRGFTANAGTQTWPPASGWASNSYYGYPAGTTAGTPGVLGVQTKATAATTGYNTFTPTVVTTDETSPFDTTKGTVYMTLGGGGTNKRDNTYGADVANVNSFTQVRNGGAVGTIAGGTKPVADASEPANWSAIRDTTDAYGVALFSVNPGTTPGGPTTITVTYLHAPTQTSGTPSYSSYDSFQLTRPRSDPTAETPEFANPAAVVGGTLALAGGAVYLTQRRRANNQAELVESSQHTHS
jgi:alkaline phosphatase D